MDRRVLNAIGPIGLENLSPSSLRRWQQEQRQIAAGNKNSDQPSKEVKNVDVESTATIPDHGSLMWVKQLGFPWWPALVDRSREQKFRCVQVQFLGSKIQHAVIAISTRSLRPWEDENGGALAKQMMKRKGKQAEFSFGTFANTHTHTHTHTHTSYARTYTHSLCVCVYLCVFMCVCVLMMALAAAVTSQR